MLNHVQSLTSSRHRPVRATCPSHAHRRLQQGLGNPTKSVVHVSTWLVFYCLVPDNGIAPIDLLASYDVNGQVTAIEELVAQGADMQIVLRLLCLASILTGGIKAKTLENLKREILQVGLGTCPMHSSVANHVLNSRLLSTGIWIQSPPASTHPRVSPSGRTTTKPTTGFRLCSPLRRKQVPIRIPPQVAASSHRRP